MDKHEVKQTARELLAAWNAGAERATDDAARADELVEQHLNEAAGMRIESGLRGGGWGSSDKNTCTWIFSCAC